MEPLSSQTRLKTNFLLTSVYFLVVWAPLLFALVSLGLSFSFESLNISFFYLLIRSAFFGLAQASLSVFTIALFSFLLGYFKTFYNLNYFVYKFLTFTSLFFFSLSPTLLALSLLNFSSALKISYSQGLLWIIICHFMMNGLFIALLFMKRVDRFQTPQTKDLVCLLKSLGAPRFKFIKYYFLPLFKNDFFSWAPQVFLWCFNSFAPILLLTESTQLATPEILFYYSILNDRGGGRILCIFILNLCLGFLFNRIFDKSFYLQENHASKNQPQLFSKKNIFSFVVFTISILFFLPFIVSLFQSMKLISFENYLFFSKDLMGSFFTSLFIAMLSFIFSFLAGFLCLISKQDSFVITYSNILSPPFILLGWLEVGFNSLNNYVSVFIVSFASFLSVFPWFYRQLKNQREQLPKEWGLYCLTLGMTPFSFIKRILYPLHRDTLIKLASVSSLWAFGEYAFSKVFFNQNQTLPLYIDENIRRYNFDASSAGVLVSFFGSFLLMFFIFKISEIRHVEI
jgi:ABC-type sulfate transport system permease component